METLDVSHINKEEGLLTDCELAEEPPVDGAHDVNLVYVLVHK